MKKKHANKKGEGRDVSYRPKGDSRSRFVLMIAITDSTFNKVVQHDPLKLKAPIESWLGKCIHCNSKLLVSGAGETNATIEHIDPLCNGSDPNDLTNLALACERCNNLKGIRHDGRVKKGSRAEEVILALKQRRLLRWREPCSTDLLDAVDVHEQQ